MVRLDESAMLELVECAYDSALNGDNWEGTLRAVARATGSQSAMLRLVDYSGRRVGFFRSVGDDPAYRQRYADYYIDLDTFRPFFESAPIGSVLMDTLLISPEERRRSEFYNDYIRPQGKAFLSGCVLARSGDATIQFGLHRGNKAGQLGQRELVFLRRFLPHLARAMQISSALKMNDAQREAVEITLHQLKHGIALLDARGKIRFMNRSMQSIVSAGHALTVWNDMFVVRPLSHESRLYALINSAIAMSVGRGGAAGGVLKLHTPPIGAVHLSVLPLMSGSCLDDLSEFRCHAVIFASHSGMLNLPWKSVAMAHGLTQAEAKVAARLAAGYGVDEVAEYLGITYHTARAHLRSIYSKTGVSRQSELVILLLQGASAYGVYAQGEGGNG